MTDILYNLRMLVNHFLNGPFLIILPLGVNLFTKLTLDLIIRFLPNLIQSLLIHQPFDQGLLIFLL